jgi:hypothetical protein
MESFERNWTIKMPDGSVRKFLMRIHEPVLTDDGEASCHVEVGEDSIKVRGIDSWHSLQLALDFAKTQVMYHEKKGGEFFSDQGHKVGSLIM